MFQTSGDLAFSFQFLGSMPSLPWPFAAFKQPEIRRLHDAKHLEPTLKEANEAFACLQSREPEELQTRQFVKGWS